MQDGDGLATYADIDELVRDTGFKPATTLECEIGKWGRGIGRTSESTEPSLRHRMAHHAKEATMWQTIEVEIDATGHIHPLEPLQTLPVGRALLTLLQPPTDEALQLAEAALAEDWLKPEEDAAWAHLQPAK